MKKKIFVGISCFILCCTNGELAKANLIDLGDNLLFDNSRNQVWYNNPMDLAGTWSESLALLAGLQTTTIIDAYSVSLEWDVATLDEVRTLDFSQQSTRDLFVPAYQAESKVSQDILPGATYDWWFSMGRVSDEAYPGTHLRASYSVRVYEDGQIYINHDEPSDWDITADDWNEYGMWVVADFSPVPELSSLFLFFTGVVGFIGIGVRGRFFVKNH